MPRRHDYVCNACGDFQEDVECEYGKHPTCECGTGMSITYAFWQDVFLEDHGRSRNETTDHNNFVKNWNCNSDPLTKLEVLSTNLKDRSISTFTPEQRKGFRERILRDGDSPAIRRDVLATRKENILSARAERQKKVGKIEGKLQ